MIANNRQHDKENQKGNHRRGSGEGEIKVVILNQVDHLSKQAHCQAYFRRTVEKVCSDLSINSMCDCPCKLICPLRSHCLGVRVSVPTIDQKSATEVQKAAKKEGFYLPEALVVLIAMKVIVLFESWSQSRVGGN